MVKIEMTVLKKVGLSKGLFESSAIVCNDVAVNDRIIQACVHPTADSRQSNA